MNEIHVSNRAQLLDDAFELVGTNISLALAEYVKNEIEYEPWFVVKKRITKLIQKMALNGRNDEVKELKVHYHRVLSFFICIQEFTP